MAVQADLDALRARRGSQSTRDDGLLASALEAAQVWTKDQVYADSYPSADVQEAVLLLAARLVKRRSSPEGVSGFDDLGVVRILSNDPDIDRLLSRHVDAGSVYGLA